MQVEDEMGMQACNLQNLPENYTMKYCAFATLTYGKESDWSIPTSHGIVL